MSASVTPSVHVASEQYYIGIAYSKYYIGIAYSIWASSAYERECVPFLCTDAYTLFGVRTFVQT